MPSQPAFQAIGALVLGVVAIAAACTLAALHAINGGEALAVVTLVAGGGATFAGVHAGAQASVNGTTAAPLTGAASPRAPGPPGAPVPEI